MIVLIAGSCCKRNDSVGVEAPTRAKQQWFKKQGKEGERECVVMKKEEQIEIAHLYEQTLSAPLTVDAAKPIIWSSTFRFPIGTHAQGVVEGQGYQ